MDPGGAWYLGLDKPIVEPPPRRFGSIWCASVCSIAWASRRVLQRARGPQRNAFAASLAVT